jgi:hypothetical protein
MAASPPDKNQLDDDYIDCRVGVVFLPFGPACRKCAMCIREHPAKPSAVD